MANKSFEFHEFSEEMEIDSNYSGQSAWKEGLHRFGKNKGAVIGLFFIVVIVLLSIFVPIFSSHPYDAVNSAYQNLPPRIPLLEKLGIFDGTRNGVNLYEQLGIEDTYFYFGTDTLGRDQFTRVFAGTRISLIVAVVATAADMVIGVAYGLISGYYGGMVDIIMQRVTEIVHGIPTLVIVTMLMLVLKPGIGNIIIALLISGWIGMSRLVRAQIMQLKEREYALASKVLGASDREIIFREILPNTSGQIIIMAMMSIPTAIFTESFLSYIGLGISAPNASLGVLINDGYKSMLMYPYLLIVPVIVFALLMISTNLFADGLRDALDPEMRDA